MTNQTRLQVLYHKTVDSRLALTKEELNEAWEFANQALHSPTRFRDAYMAVETLLFQAYRGQICSDRLPDPRKCEIGKDCPVGILQSLIDRVDGVNSYVDR